MLKEIIKLEKARERYILPHREKINKIISRYDDKIKAIQNKCKHINTKTQYSNNGDGWSICEYTQYENHRCEDCGFIWETTKTFMGP